MAYSLSVTNITNSSATIEISGMDTGTSPEYYERWKKFEFILWDSNGNLVSGYDPWESGEVQCSDGTFEFTYSGLSSGSYYDFRVVAYKLVDGLNDDWSREIFYTSNFTTAGGGGGNEPHFIAYPEDNNTAIYVRAYDLEYVRYDSVQYEISSSSYSDIWTGLGSHTFSDLPDGEYEVSAWYIYRDTANRILTEDEERYVRITIGGGGGGWQLVSEDKGTLYHSETYPLRSGLTASRLYSYSIVFNTAGTYTFSSSGGADLIGWLSGWDQSTWNNNPDGWPDQHVPDNYLIRDDSHGTGDNFSFEYTCAAGEVYYLWFRQWYGYEYSGSDISITISSSSPPTPGTWTFTQVSSITNPSSTVTRPYTLSAGNGYYLAVQFSASGRAAFYTEGSGDDIGFLTASDSGYDPDQGVPYDIVPTSASGDEGTNDDGGTGQNFRIEYPVTAGATYYLWFRMLSSADSGNVTLYVTPPSSPQTGGYVWIYTNSGWVRAKPYIYTSNGWKPATAYIYAGGTWKPVT